MFQKLVSHNDDIRRLVEKGFAVGFDSNYLIIRDIPYLDDKGSEQIGAFVTKLVFTDPDHVVQEDHQVFFAGSFPHNIDGSQIANLGGGPTTLALGPAAADLVVQRQFSNKPLINGVLSPFPNFFDKIVSYTGIISGPATAKFGSNSLSFRIVDEVADQSVFKISDTLTSRAEITELSARFKDDVIAIIGLGGTGSYLLDFAVKTPVKEIRAFDLDEFHVHNAFRSPGALQLNEFRKSKADIYQARYENFRHGLTIKAQFIDQSSAAEFEGVTFVFVCVDKGSARAGIFELLMSLKIPFIDVGMGLNRKQGPLNGMARVTYFSAEDAEKVKALGLAELSDHENDLYRTNIQIAELNALDASLAIGLFKQIRGFYYQKEPLYHLLFEIADSRIVTRAVDNEA